MESGAKNAQLESNLLLLLERTRDVYGYLPEHALMGLADHLGLPVVDVYAAATFYRSLPMSPLGRHVIKMCKSVPCYLKHNLSVVDAIEKELGIRPGQTSYDGRFSLQTVNCIGACDKAPAMMIDDDVFGDLTPARVRGILAEYE